jgi:iron complex outermembrane recepter protein
MAAYTDDNRGKFMINRPARGLISLCLLAAGAATTHPALAQIAAPANGDAASGEGLQEIVVTAQRREETAQRAAIAISTVSGAAITEANVTRPGGLSDLVPALQATDDTGPYSIFYVRGVGNFAANALSDPALLFNFDGVAVSRAGTSGFFYDLERVEVLKGPQGTLYGRNATGGAINVISKAPVLGEFSGDASIQYGNYSANRDEVALNLPLGDISAVRLAAFHVQHLGYMEDGTENQDDTGARVSFLAAPTDTLQIKFVADYFHQGGDQAGGTVTGITNSFTTAPNFSPGDRLGFFSPQVEAYLQTQKDFLNGANFLPFQNVNNEDNRFYGISTTIDWKTPVGTVTVIPAYRDSKLDYSSFATGVLLSEISHEKQTSVEARLASDNDQAFRYVVGAYYLDDPEDVPLYNINQQANATFSQYSTETISHAAFANLSYEILPDVRLAGGVRYTKDDKEFVGGQQANSIICTVQTPFGPSCPNAGVLPYSQTAAIAPSFFNPNGTITTLNVINNNQSASYNKVTWRAGADWDITDKNLLYGSVETGFKSGGFFFSSDYDVYQPETITAYTIGSKNRFLDNRLQANVELFYWKYRNQQISHLSTDSAHDTIFPTQNVGQSTIKGIELDLQARPLQNTLLSADIQYNDAVYNSFVYQTPNNNGGVSNGTGCPSEAVSANTYTVNCSGMQPPYAPRWSLSLGAQETIPLPNDGSLVGNARVHYQSETLTALDFLPAEVQSGYAKWDFDMTYYTRNNRYYAGAYIDNAFNKTALAFSFVTPFSSFLTSTLQPPRTYGLRVGMHF